MPQLENLPTRYYSAFLKGILDEEIYEEILKVLWWEVKKRRCIG